MTAEPSGTRGARWGAVGVAIGLTVWGLSGLYSLGSDEEGLVLRFGAFARREGPGLHYRLPAPIESVVVVRSRMVRSVALDEKSKQRLMLTGDENIINVKWLVQFSVKDPRAWAFTLDAPEDVMKSVLDCVLLDILATRTVDDVLTTGKTQMQEKARTQAQQRLDRLGAGVNLISVNLTESSPPEAVVEAFNDVASAREDADKYQHEAEAYVNGLLPSARGEAQQALAEAQGEGAARVLRARGDAARFESLLAAYRRAPALVRRRLLIESVESVLASMRKLIASRGTASYVFEDLEY